MKLYCNPVSTYSQKVLIALYEKGLEFDTEMVDLMNPGGRAKYREIYPMGKVPLLVLEGGHVIPESSIIIEYIDGMAEPALIKGDADETRRIRFKDRMFDLYLNNPIVTLLFQGMKPENERDPEKIETAEFQVNTMYQFMQHEFGNQPFANGAEFLMSDCAAAPALFYAQQVLPFDEHDNIVKYWKRLQARPSIQRVHKEAAPILAAIMEKNAA